MMKWVVGSACIAALAGCGPIKCYLDTSAFHLEAEGVIDKYPELDGIVIGALEWMEPEAGRLREKTSAGDVLVLGETGKGTGAETLLACTGGETVAQAIVEADGFSYLAEQRQVRVFRKDEELGWKIILVNFYAFLRYGDTRQNIRLEAGDLVYVPRKALRGESFRHHEEWTLAASYVAEVESPTELRSRFRENLEHRADPKE